MIERVAKFPSLEEPCLLVFRKSVVQYIVCRRRSCSVTALIVSIVSIAVILVSAKLQLRPNPSVKRSAAGRPPSPRAAVVYPASRGLGVLPSSPAYLER